MDVLGTGHGLKGEDSPLNGYQQTFQKATGCQNIDAELIEAAVRVQHPTLDSLTAQRLASLGRTAFEALRIEPEFRRMMVDELGLNANPHQRLYLFDCECDNTHQQNNTVCQWCHANGRRRPSDKAVSMPMKLLVLHQS